MTAIDDGVVKDLQIQCFALVIGTGKAGADAVDKHVVTHDGLSLHLHDAVATVVAEVALDDIYGLSSGAINGDARILRVMHVVLGDEISPGALFDFDAIPLVTPAIMNVVQRDDAFTHDDTGIVSPQIHALSMTRAMVDVIAGEVQPLGIGAVGTETNLTCMMNVAAVQPDITAMA